MNSKKSKPTNCAYSELQYAYDFFNKRLFEGILPDCILTFQREKRTFGYFSRKRWIAADNHEVIDEIALNPAYFAPYPTEEIMQTLVHEMAHQWQFHFGTPGRRGYHNKEWGAKMEEIGLMPSSTGKPGGKKTGEKMADYIIVGGRFEKLCKTLFTEDFKISWVDRYPVKIEGIKTPEFITESITQEIQNGEQTAIGLATLGENNNSNRWKYSCEKCGVNVWGKPELRIRCDECGERFVKTG